MMTKTVGDEESSEDKRILFRFKISTLEIDGERRVGSSFRWRLCEEVMESARLHRESSWRCESECWRTPEGIDALAESGYRRKQWRH